MSVKSMFWITTLAAIGFAGSASAGVNLVANGGFELTVPPGPNVFIGAGLTAADWAYTGISSTIYAAGTADTTGASDPSFGHQVFLWGPGTGSANGLTASSPPEATSSPSIPTLSTLAY
jgi:hypothetical protein